MQKLLRFPIFPAINLLFCWESFQTSSHRRMYLSLPSAPFVLLFFSLTLPLLFFCPLSLSLALSLSCTRAHTHSRALSLSLSLCIALSFSLSFIFLSFSLLLSRCFALLLARSSSFLALLRLQTILLERARQHAREWECEQERE